MFWWHFLQFVFVFLYKSYIYAQTWNNISLRNDYGGIKFSNQKKTWQNIFYITFFLIITNIKFMSIATLVVIFI